MTESYHQPTDKIDPDILNAIGLVATRWSYLEALVEDAIAQLMEIDEGLCYTVTATMQIAGKVDALVALAKLRLDPDSAYPEFNTLIKQIDDLRPLRNRVVHALWSTTADPTLAKVTVIKSTRRLRGEDYLMSATDVKKIADDIGHLGVAFLAFVRGLAPALECE